jgi:endo-1,4-beta-xylanase
MYTRRNLTRQAARLSFAAFACVVATACSGGSPTGPSAAPQPSPAPTPTASTLREAASSRGLSYGCAVGAAQLTQDAAFAALVSRECGMVVPENDLKWTALRPTASSFSFDRADAVMQFATEHGIKVRGHTLVWHEALPAWFAGSVRAADADAVLRQHISTVVSRYAGRMHSWDVVNEAIHLADGRPDGLRNTPWLRLLGPDYIETAFRAAAAADPSAMLVYNEYGLEYAANEPKRQAVLTLMRRLKERGVPVHAIGIQAHLNARDQVDVAGLQRFLGEISALGLKVLITEMDVADASLPSDAAVRDQAVADQYERFMGAVLKQSGTVAVMTWGLSDRYSWLHDYSPRGDGLPVRGLPFDQGLGQKVAYQAMLRSLTQAPMQ